MNNRKQEKIVSRFEPLTLRPHFHRNEGFSLKKTDPTRSLSAAIPTTSSLKNFWTRKSSLVSARMIGVKYGFIFGLKKLLLLKSISQFTKKKTNKQRKRKQAYAWVDLDLDDS